MIVFFIDYAYNSSAYRFLVYESEIPDIHPNTFMESRNAKFFEDVFPFRDNRVPRPVLETEPF